MAKFENVGRRDGTRTGGNAAVKEIGENVIGVQGDGSKQGDRDPLSTAVADTGRRLDVVFANAAAIDVARIGEVSQEHLQKALPLLNDGGSIILNSSNTPWRWWRAGPARRGARTAEGQLPAPALIAASFLALAAATPAASATPAFPDTGSSRKKRYGE